jgi:hypothetical protein
VVTRAFGDEAAARLAAKFGAVARECLSAREGQVISLQGDEAVAVFGSARQALRAAVELQARFDHESALDPSLPLLVGVGVDTGEAVKVVDGYIGAALNLAARLCELAGPHLGMIDSSYGLPEALVPRLVLRGPAAHEPDLDTPIFRQRAWGSAGVFSTARDMAIFGQMFLNGGVYGDQRILSPASVAAMTHDRLPGIPARIINEFFPEASWGLGWSIHGRKTGWCGGLYSPRAYEHWGSGGVYLWVDPTYDVVGAYFSVIPVPEADPGYTELQDLFTDAVTAALVDL